MCFSCKKGSKARSCPVGALRHRVEALEAVTNCVLIREIFWRETPGFLPMLRKKGVWFPEPSWQSLPRYLSPLKQSLQKGVGKGSGSKFPTKQCFERDNLKEFERMISYPKKKISTWGLRLCKVEAQKFILKDAKKFRSILFFASTQDQKKSDFTFALRPLFTPSNFHLLGELELKSSDLSWYESFSSC